MRHKCRDRGGMFSSNKTMPYTIYHIPCPKITHYRKNAILIENFTSNEVFRKRFNYILQYRDEQNSKTKRRNSKENQEKTKSVS